MSNHLYDAVVRRGLDHAPCLTGSPDLATYAVLRRRVAQMADALVTLGVEPGDRVAAQIEKSPDGLLLYLATVAAGAVFLPLNSAYTAAELGYFLNDAEPSLVVCDPAAEAATAPLVGRARLATLAANGSGSLRDAADAASERFTPVARGAADLAAILYTSGTTGRSKGAMLTHGNLVSNAETLAALWRFTADDRLLHALPVYHTHGLFTACNTILAAGASLIYQPRFDPPSVLEALPEATAMMGVPTFYTRLLASPDLTADATRHMRLFVSGSAPLLAETHRAWRERTGHAILERYGMTETNMICSNPFHGERRPGTVGFPLPGVSVRVVDERDGGARAAGAIGSIEVKGPNVFAGYWRNPEKTAADFRGDGFFVTGDLGSFDAEGYLTISGRGKDLIISGGFNVYPKEVELLIDAVPGVRESAVIGVPHPDYGEGVTAVVATEGGVLGDALEERILAALDGALARYKQPKRIVTVNELPRNAMGKVQKSVLRATYEHIYRS